MSYNWSSTCYLKENIYYLYLKLCTLLTIGNMIYIMIYLRIFIKYCIYYTDNVQHKRIEINGSCNRSVEKYWEGLHSDEIIATIIAIKVALVAQATI
jgi:hypothetical protein